MNKVLLSWMDFLVKCFIVTLAVYVMVNNFFLTDIRYVAERVGRIEAVAQHTYNQTNQLLMAVQDLRARVDGIAARK